MKFRSIILLAFFSIAFVLNAQGQKFHLLIGSSEGINVYEFNSQTGELKFKSKTTGNSAGYLTVTADRKHVYTASSGSTIAAYGYNSTSGELTFLNKQPAGGSGPAYVSVDALGKYIFAANYGGGSVSALPIEKDGSLGADIQVIKHEGSSIDKTRQTKPYVHSVVVTPDNRYVITADLGTDKMNIYSFDPKKRPAPLTPAAQPFASLEPGSGPRHSTFHPNKKYYYVVNEVNSKIDAFNYKGGHLTHIQTVAMLPEGFTGIGEAADIHVSPDGKFLYGTTRTVVNEVVSYSIDQKTGKLTFVGRQSSLGKESRTFEIDPTGSFLVVTNQESNTVIIFKRNQKTGLLTPTGQKIEINRPSCVKFVRID